MIEKPFILRMMLGERQGRLYLYPISFMYKYRLVFKCFTIFQNQTLIFVDEVPVIFFRRSLVNVRFLIAISQRRQLKSFHASCPRSFVQSRLLHGVLVLVILEERSHTHFPPHRPLLHRWSAVKFGKLERFIENWNNTAASNWCLTLDCLTLKAPRAAHMIRHWTQWGDHVLVLSVA